MNPQNPPNPPSETPPESKLRKYKKIIIIASIFFLVLILLTTFILLFTKKGESKTLQNTEKETTNVKKATLSLTLTVTNTATPLFTLKEAKVIEGFSPQYPQIKNSYKLELLNKEQKVFRSISFNINNQPIVESWDNGTISQQKIAKKTTEDISVFTPYSENIKSIRIINPLGEEVFAINLEGIKTTFNIEALVKKAQADLSSGKLNLTFISSNYTDMEQFAFDVKRFSDYVLTVEPFKKRSSQIVFNSLENNEDLGCTFFSGAGGGYGLMCDNTKAQQIVASNTPFDKIIILHNQPDKFGGGAYPKDIVSTVSNAPSEEVALVHELGHQIGGLLDEYTGLYPVTTENNTVYANCFTGTPIENITEPFWIGTTLDEYKQGCNYPDWYRSSENSVMKSLDSHSYNEVSLEIMEASIDEIAGPFIETHPSASPSPLSSSSTPAVSSISPYTFSPIPSPQTPQPIASCPPKPTPNSEAISVGWFIPNCP